LTTSRFKCFTCSLCTLQMVAICRQYT
jgi:hypothetical protein